MPSDDINTDESPPPVTDNVKSFSSAPPEITLNEEAPEPPLNAIPTASSVAAPVTSISNIPASI